MDIFPATSDPATSDGLRLIGLLAVGVGLAWAIQVLGCGDCAGFDGLLWVLGAATFAGAGTGLVCASETAVNARASGLIEA